MTRLVAMTVWVAGAAATFLTPGAAQADPCAGVVRELTYGETAAEVAKSPADFGKAAKEFEAAAKKAPECPAAFFNLGIVLEKAEQYAPAKAALQAYLKLAPKAPDAPEVAKRIYRLEYLAKNAAKGGVPTAGGFSAAEVARVMTGVWISRDQGFEYAYRATPEGADGVLVEFDSCRRGCKNSSPFPVNRYHLRADGADKLSGRLEQRFPNSGGCVGRTYEAPVTAFLAPDGQSLVLRIGPHRTFVTFTCSYHDNRGHDLTLTRR